MSKAWWWTMFAWLMYMATRYTWLKGIPGAEPLAGFFCIFGLSWMFSEWLTNRLLPPRSKGE